MLQYKPKKKGANMYVQQTQKSCITAPNSIYVMKTQNYPSQYSATARNELSVLRSERCA